MNWNFIIFSVVKIAIVIGVVQGMVAYAVLAERKISAWIQDRVGPNRCAPPFAKYIPVVGPALIRLGIFQPLADGLKFMLKEDFTPAGVRKVYFWLAPAIAVIPSMLVIAVIPFGSQLGQQTNGHRGFERRHPLHVRHRVARRLWHRAGGLRGELEISVPRRHPFERADDFVRNFDGHVGDSGVSDRGQFEFEPDHRLAGAARLAGALRAGFVHHFPGRVVCGNQPPAVRFAGGGNRTGRRLSHRIQLDEIRAVFPRANIPT